MVYNTKLMINDEKKKLSEEILLWSQGREKILNIVSLPYSSSIIFLSTILSFCKNGRKVLYITGEDRSYIEILDLIRKFSRNRDYSYIKDPNILFHSSLVVCKHSIAQDINEKFDLVIYDDIRSFPEESYNYIKILVNYKCKEEGKIICYSIEEIFSNVRTFELPVRANKMPIIEPKVITTRIDINKDIPYVIYDYLKWSMKCEKKVVIYVPNKDKVVKVSEYLEKYERILGKNLIKFIKDESDIKILFNFLKMNRGIMITDDFYETGFELKAINVMVFFADDSMFNYKKLLYFCGKVGRSGRIKKEEVLFLTKESTNEIEKAKDIARRFNKEAWERGLLDL